MSVYVCNLNAVLFLVGSRHNDPKPGLSSDMYPSQRLFFRSAIKLCSEHNSHLASTKRTSAYRLVSFPEQPPLSISQKNAANKLFSKPTRFLLSIPDPKHLPAYRNPEVPWSMHFT